MKPTWSYTAKSFLGQLSSVDRSNVRQAVERLPADWETLDGDHLKPVMGDEPDLYALRVGNDFLALLTRRDDLISVIDVFPKAQIDGLRQLMEEQHAVPG